MTLDAGYWSEDNARACTDKGIDAYIATGWQPYGKPPPAKRGPLPKDADAKTRMARKLRSKKGSKIYARRKVIVEPVNGQIKEGLGLRRFLLRCLEKVNGEWHLIAATHNLLKLFRHRRSQQQVLLAAGGAKGDQLRHCPDRGQLGFSIGLKVMNHEGFIALLQLTTQLHDLFTVIQVRSE